MHTESIKKFLKIFKPLLVADSVECLLPTVLGNGANTRIFCSMCCVCNKCEHFPTALQERKEGEKGGGGCVSALLRWNVLLDNIHLQKLLQVYCPGHAGAKGNYLKFSVGTKICLGQESRPYTLAGKATLTRGLFLRRFEVLKSLRHYLQTKGEGHHTINHPEERGVERGSPR